LPPDIAIKNINLVPDDFHARYSAISRTYSYLITKNKNPILIDRAWFFDKTINTQLIKDNLSTLMGIHDFSAFAKKMPISNYNCNIYDATIQEYKDYIIFLLQLIDFCDNGKKYRRSANIYRIECSRRKIAK